MAFTLIRPHSVKAGKEANISNITVYFFNRDTISFLLAVLEQVLGAGGIDWVTFQLRCFK